MLKVLFTYYVVNEWFLIPLELNTNCKMFLNVGGPAYLVYMVDNWLI